MRNLLLAAALLCAALPSYASNTTYTATVSDTDGQNWINGTWYASLVLPSGPFGGVTPTVSGNPVPAFAKGVIDSNGLMTVNVTNPQSLDQTGAVWQITVCPNASVSQNADTGCVMVPIKDTGGDMTARFTGLKAPRFPAGPNAFGYSDAEVVTPTIPGLQYFNTGSVPGYQGLRIWDGKQWKGVGAGGGGGGNPAGSNYDVQLNLLNSFAADPGRFVYNPTSHFLTSNANGKINSDLYNTGNNGIATALAATECGTNCQVYVPPTSADAEQLPLPSAGKLVFSDRGGNRVRITHNVGTVSTYNTGVYTECSGLQSSECYIDEFDTPDTSLSVLPHQPQGRTHVFRMDGWLWNYGNCPACGTLTWGVGKLNATAARVNSQGIFQMHSDYLRKYGTGDTVVGHSVDALVDGGQPDYSGEGVVVDRALTGETSDWYHGLVTSGATTGATTLPVTYNTGISAKNRNTTSSGAFLLDISQGTITGTLTGTPSVLSGFPTTIGVAPTNAMFTPTTAAGKLSCDLPPADSSNANILNTQTCTITGMIGTSGTGFANGKAVLAGDFPEGVTVSSVGTKSGTSQTVTITYKNPHGAAQTSLWQGGSAIGQFVCYDSMQAVSGYRECYHVYGATDATHMVVEQSYPGSGGPFVPYIAPIQVLNLTKSGTTVSAIVTNSNVNIGQFRNVASAVVTGCSDSGLNGAASNITVDYANNALTWTEAAGGTGCSSAYLGFPDSANGFHLYPGAAVLGPAVDNPTSIPLEPNQVPWTAGDQIEIPHHPMLSIQQTRWFQTINNPIPNKPNASGIFFAFGGGGINSNYRSVTLANLNGCGMYQGCGGTLDPPPAIEVGGYGQNGINGGVMKIDSPPLLGKSMFNVGCHDAANGGCGNQDPISIFSFASDANGLFAFYPKTHDIVASNLTAGIGTNYAYGNFRGGSFYVKAFMNDAPNAHGIFFTNTSGTEITRMGLCNRYSNTAEVTFGVCTALGATDTNVTNGKVNTGSLRVQNDATFGNVTVGLQPPNYAPALSYTGTAGTTTRNYYYASQSPLGIQGTPANITGIGNTQASLDASNYVTITCPTSLQANWPAGTTYHVLARASVSNTVDLGVCPVGGSVKDDGSLTNGAPGLANISLAANTQSTAGAYYVNSGGGLGFYSSNRSGTIDVFLNRLGPNKLGIGSTMGTSHNGTLELGGLQLDNIASGTQCLQADASGNITGTGTACGAGGGGGGTVTSFSSTAPPTLFTTSVATATTTPALSFTLTNANAHNFFGNCSGTAGAPNYCQPSFGDISGTAAAVQLPLATTAAVGAVKPDGTTVTIDVDGTIHSSGGSGISGLTTGYLPQATSSTAIGNSFIDYGVTNAGAYTSTKDIYAPAFHSTDTGGAGFGFVGTEGTAPAGLAGSDGLWADSTAHRLMMNNNNTGALTLVGIGAAGTSGHIAVFSASGLDIQDSGAAGVTASGTSCTITAITNGIITGATCP